MKLPVLRGMVGLIESLVLGYKTLTYSFEKAGFEEEEPTKFELWLSKTFGKSVMQIVTVLRAYWAFCWRSFCSCVFERTWSFLTKID